MIHSRFCSRKDQNNHRTVTSTGVTSRYIPNHSSEHNFSKKWYLRKVESPIPQSVNELYFMGRELATWEHICKLLSNFLKNLHCIAKNNICQIVTDVSIPHKSSPTLILSTLLIFAYCIPSALQVCHKSFETDIIVTVSGIYGGNKMILKKTIF